MSIVVVTFNIGSIRYQVSKELLNKYSNTMLYTVAVEMETSNDDVPIFIDGNSERFPFVLDYMRYHKVELPSFIGKESLLKDLDYYGFQNIQFNDIDTLLQKIKRKERLGLIMSRCLGYFAVGKFTIIEVGSSNSIRSCIYGGNSSNDRL